MFPKWRNPLLCYMCQNEVWSDKRISQARFCWVVLPFMRAYMPSSKKIVLVVHKFVGHDKDFLAHTRIDVYGLHLNCTDIHQLMDVEVISAWKLRYWASLWAWIVNVLSKRLQFWECAENLLKGIKWIVEGPDANVLDVASMLKDAWGDTPIHTLSIVGSRQMCPTHPQFELKNAMGKVLFEDCNALDDFQACIQSIQAMVYFPTKD